MGASAAFRRRPETHRRCHSARSPAHLMEKVARCVDRLLATPVEAASDRGLFTPRSSSLMVSGNSFRDGPGLSRARSRSRTHMLSAPRRPPMRALMLLSVAALAAGGCTRPAVPDGRAALAQELAGR